MPDKNDVVIINLDRPRELRFGHKALKTLTALTGKSIDNFEMDGNDLEEIEKIMYCGLLSDARENKETLKLEDMEDLLDHAPSYGELFEKMKIAFEAAFGQAEEDSKNLQRVAEMSKKTKK
jgi:hypothetical protein